MNKPFNPPPGMTGPQPPHGWDPYALPERSLVNLARDATPDLVELWRGVMARKWIVLGLTAMVTGITVFVLLQMTPIYRSTATILIEHSPSKVVGIDQVYGAITNSREYYNTQAEFLKSQDVALRVIRKLGLASHPEFDPRRAPQSEWKRWLNALVRANEKETPPESLIERQALSVFRERLEVRPVRNSQLVEVSFESSNADLAANVANATATAYIDADMDARFMMTQQANVWLTGRLSELKANLEASERALQGYREAHGIADTKNLALGGQSKQVEELTNRLVEARVQRTQVEESLKAARLDPYSAPAVIRDAAVAAARQAQAAAEQKFAEIRQKYGPAFPTYKQTEEELAAARANARRAADAVISSMEKEFRAAKAAEDALEAALGRARGGVQETNRRELELANYEREVETNRHLYETFLARVKETDIAGDIQTPVARVVDPALPSLKPIKPRFLRTTSLAAITSLLGAVFLATVLHRLDNTIKSTESAEEKLRAAVLGTLPKLTKDQQKAAAQLISLMPRSAFAEGVRTIGTAVQLSALDEPHKVIAVTSSLPQEGKSTLAINLSLSQSSTKRVLLIDGDLRRPVLTKRFGLTERGPGLSDLLSESAITDAIRTLENSRLSILPAGQQVPNPLELLSSDRFQRLMAALRSQFDLIVIDCPPLQLVSDALIIARYATGAVFVVETGATRVSLARKNIRRLRDAGAIVFGVALNKYDPVKARRYYGDYAGYSDQAYYYGDDYERTG